MVSGCGGDSVVKLFLETLEEENPLCKSLGSPSKHSLSLGSLSKHSKVHPNVQYTPCFPLSTFPPKTVLAPHFPAFASARQRTSREKSIKAAPMLSSWSVTLHRSSNTLRPAARPLPDHFRRVRLQPRASPCCISSAATTAPGPS